MDTVIELDTLKKITNNFSDDQKVGSGGYGDVYKAVYNQEEIAVKLLHVANTINDDLFMNELKIHMKVQHPNIVRLVGYCNVVNKKYLEQNGMHVFGKHIYKVLCFQYMQGGSLRKRLSEHSLGDDWHTHYQIIKGTCEGLCYLHHGCERPIWHLDLNPANILLDRLMKPKIADFGLSTIYTASRSHVIRDSVVGTKYMPPELLKRGEISEMTDVFSLGVTIIDVIKGPECYDAGDTNFVEDVLTYWRKRDRTADLDQVETCAKIAIRCLRRTRKERPTIKEIIANLSAMETQVLSKGLHALTAKSSSNLPGPSSVSARAPLDVVLVYAFDCSTSNSAWYAVDDGVFWLVQEKLAKFADSCFGYIYVMLTGNTYTSDMKLVDPAETRATGYTGFDRRRISCAKNMACGLSEAHKMMSNRGHTNGIILLFSDGQRNMGDFFDGAENFASQVPVHTFTLDLDGDAYNHVLLRSIAANSPGGKFHTNPVPERPILSTAFSKLLDNILAGTPVVDEKPPTPISGRGPLDVVLVYAFDCTDWTTAWHTVDNGVFWLLQEKLTHFQDSCMGYIYVMSSPNTYTSDMKVVDPADTKETGYTGFARRRMACTKNMVSGLAEAHRMIRNRGHHNGIIFFFSDGLINKGDFFDGTDNFISKVPVHTFTLGGDAYSKGLQSIAAKSPGGRFNPVPVPERPLLSAPFSKLLDSLLSGTIKG